MDLLRILNINHVVQLRVVVGLSARRGEWNVLLCEIAIVFVFLTCGYGK